MVPLGALGILPSHVNTMIIVHWRIGFVGLAASTSGKSLTHTVIS